MSLPVRYNLEKNVCDAYEVRGATSSSLHGHHHFLITYITRGRGVQILNGKEIEFFAGDLFILSPADFHQNILPLGESYDYFGVKFHYELLDTRLCELCELDRFPVHIHLSKTTEEKLRPVFEMLVEECSGIARSASDTLCRALVETVFVLAIRELPRLGDTSPSAFVNRALGYLHSNFHEQITVADAAAYVGYTPNYFNSLFKANFGTTFAAYLRDMRLTYAKNLLLSGDISLTEIAIEAGFGSLSYFSRVFSGEYGISPKQFRHNSRKQSIKE